MQRLPFIRVQTEFPAVALLGAIASASAYLADHLPEQVIVHWSLAGEPDGIAPRSFVVWMFPLLALFVYLLMLVLWRFDPKRARYIEFARAYHAVKTMLIAFIAGLYAVVASNSLGYEVSVPFVMPPLIGVLFVGIGAHLSEVRQNWMFGIRTPWTLSSEKVWDRTHRFAGYTFVFGGALSALGAFLPGSTGAFLFFASILGAALLPVAYSFILYRFEETAHAA